MKVASYLFKTKIAKCGSTNMLKILVLMTKVFVTHYYFFIRSATVVVKARRSSQYN